MPSIPKAMPVILAAEEQRAVARPAATKRSSSWRGPTRIDAMRIVEDERDTALASLIKRVRSLTAPVTARTTAAAPFASFSADDPVPILFSPGI